MPAVFVATSDQGPNRYDAETTISVTVPVGSVAGDGIFVWLDSGNGTVTMSSIPSGWTTARDSRWGGVGYRRVIAYSILTPAEISAGSVDFVWSGGALGQYFAASYRDVLDGAFFTISSSSDVGIESSGPGGDVTVTCPSVTTVEPDSLILRFASFQGWFVSDIGTITEEAGHTERLDYAPVDNAWTLGFQEDDTPQADPGASGTQTVTGNDLDANGGTPDYRTEAWTVAIAPALLGATSLTKHFFRRRRAA